MNNMEARRKGYAMKIICSLTGLFVVIFLLTGCTSVGNLGIVTKPSADAASLLKSGRAYKELGPAEGEACRHFLLAIIPWGDSSFSTAVNNALAEKGGDALVNVTVSSSLYGFIPIYNVYSYTCTTVKGIAVKFQ
ncbi:MAG: hypothetical protein DMG85_21815 [Acidobacteria bacterium]|nr:MAG: hypothetical protein DMG85_21815 [Acidobacteriota bacterium]